MRWLDSMTDSMDMNLSKLKIMENKGVYHAAVHVITKSWTWLSDQTKARKIYISYYTYKHTHKHTPWNENSSELSPWLLKSSALFFNRNRKYNPRIHEH